MRNFISILFLALLGSCSIPTYEGSIDYSREVYKSAPILVSIGSYNDTLTKSAGAIDTEEFWRWSNTNIFVYAFRKDAQGFGAFYNDGSGECILDGTADGNANAGRMATVSVGESYVTWSNDDSTAVYPTGYTAHDFYAYYIDDCEHNVAQINRAEESITVPVTINGSQDVMSAKAEVTMEQLNKFSYTEQVKNILLNSAYSAYSANMGVHPELYFKHHLVRFSFVVFPGSKEAQSICIEQITVDSQSNAVFTVAHKDTTMMGLDFSADSELVPLSLREKDAKNPLPADKYFIIWGEGDENREIYERSSLEIGGSLLVAPANSYACKVSVKDVDSMESYSYDFEIVSAAGAFTAGNHYTVRMCIYGRTEVVTDVVVNDWKDGGDYDIDVK